MKDRTWLRLTPGRTALLAMGALALNGCSNPPTEAPPAKPAVVAAAPAAPEVPAAPAEPKPVDPAKLLAPFKLAPVKDAPQVQDTEVRIALGRMLFHDPRLSKNHDISCNTCHNLATFGVDNKALSDGHRGQKGTRNSPTVYNAANHVAQFWDGRAPTLEVQAEGPIFNPVEMAMPDDKRLVATLNSIPQYVKHFKQAFPGEKKPVTAGNAARAIAAFERQLTTPSRFDQFLAGEQAALTEAERRGLELFVSSGCTTCHNGPAVGGTSFQKLGLIEEWPHLADKGRFDVTRNEEDQAKFRVPTLRNVDKTGPYLHDGSVQALPEMVRLMAKHQLGKTLKDSEVEDVVAFLRSLTGELPQHYLAPPELPKSTRKTPEPDPS
ncbi:cytochrome-c peroxidase [Hyalangium rubrum]|uniref:Cytochrome c peroxidase n=1 Tax=Hyalangium rubrum TaxID=3103134 RepID=A0ABU5H5V8_9BACT|nr:cytochrome c peroxidase [Hyalangium sp. s54d21]MDY7228843.1 cytochrome c peroxidase [Hyalangium sp. s54d21]